MFWRQEGEREELGLRKNQDFGKRSSPFLVSKLSKRKKKSWALKGKRFQGKNQTLDFFK